MLWNTADMQLTATKGKQLLIRNYNHSHLPEDSDEVSFSTFSQHFFHAVCVCVCVCVGGGA